MQVFDLLEMIEIFLLLETNPQSLDAVTVKPQNAVVQDQLISNPQATYASLYLWKFSEVY